MRPEENGLASDHVTYQLAHWRRVLLRWGVLPPPRILSRLRQLLPYERMAETWSDTRLNTLDGAYERFLPSLLAAHGVPMTRALELACGTGDLVAHLSTGFDQVVGIDLSDSMLAMARERTQVLHNVELRHASFSDFELDGRFALVTCASDSINYAAGPQDLYSVFQCVRRHLSEGGIFVFDAVSAANMEAFRGVRVIEHRGKVAWMSFSFDAQRNRGCILRVYPDAMETHIQWPIEPSDVETAARLAGLRVLSHPTEFERVGGADVGSGRHFYVLGHGAPD